MADFGWTQGEWEVWGEVEETTREDFRREFVDRAGGVYRTSEPDPDIGENPFGESKLKHCKKLLNVNPMFCRTLSEYSFSRFAISQDR